MRRAAALGALLLVGGTQGAEVVTHVNQGSGLAQLNIAITNNDNAIYNSATFDLMGTYGNLLKAIRDHRPGYSGKTIQQIGADVGVTIRSNPTGEVNTGWVASYSEATGKVTLMHNNGFPGFDYDAWNSSDPYNDMMALTFDFGNLLDFNGNGQTDANEVLVQRGYLTNGFVALPGGYPGHPPKYESAGVLEEGEGLLIEDVGEWMKVKGTGLVPYGEYELERSADLEIWETVEEI